VNELLEDKWNGLDRVVHGFFNGCRWWSDLMPSTMVQLKGAYKHDCADADNNDETDHSGPVHDEIGLERG
jgi:hypothetical protein